jgi:hypothetical protein
MRSFFGMNSTLLALSAALLTTASHLHAASLLEWNTAGNAGTETTEPSTFAAVNIAAAPLTIGPGVNPAGNANRFGGSNWFDSGNSNPQTLSESIAGNDFIQFVVTPNSGFGFTATGFNFIWDRSSTGPNSVALRSSADAFGSDLASATGLTTTQTTFTNLSFSLTSTSATTFRLYGFGGTDTAGTAGFDTNSSTNPNPNVLLLGTVNALPAATPLPASAWSGLTALTLAATLLCLRSRRTLA